MWRGDMAVVLIVLALSAPLGVLLGYHLGPAGALVAFAWPWAAVGLHALVKDWARNR